VIRSLLILLLLGGCALQPAAPTVRPMHAEVAPFAMNGRISIKHDAARDSAGLRWTHQAQTDEILLLTPLGQTAARIYSDDNQATLDEGDKHYQDQDVESLMMQVLGWRLQLDGLHHWVLGMKAASDAQVVRDELGRLTVLHQDGWEVRYLRYADDKADSLPARMQLSRENLQILLLIDEWEWNPK
jgi:outer membrane lipoprotein LolB